MDTVVIILGLLTLILSIVVSRCFPKREAVGKMPPGFKSPVLAFEFIRNQHELTALFAINPPEKRQETIKHVNKGNRLDFGFALMYSLLAATLAYFLLDKTRLSAPWHGLITGAAVVSALVAGGSDMLENTILLRIADKQSLSAKPDEFRQLTRFVTIKFTMLTLSLALTLPFWFELIQDGKVVFKIWSGLTIVLIVAGLTGAFLSIFRLDLRHLSNAEPLIPNLLTLCVMYKYSILSFDGGGIRGIIPGQVMVTLEAKLAERVAQNPSLKLLYPNEVRLADFFDFFAGTSTGGILTSLYLCPDPKNLTRPRFSAQEAVNLYLEYGDDIFEVSVWKKIASGDGILDEKHDATQLERLLKRYFGNTKLSELLKPCLITSYDIRRRRTHFFNQNDAIKSGNSHDFFVRDVCRATSAAPTYFETSLINSLDDVAYPLIDGGVFANNPALCAYSEVRNMKPELTAKDMLIVSLGTGSENEPYAYNTARNWGAIGWVRPVIDIMMSGAAEVTNYHLTKMFEAVKKPKQYIRFQPSDLRDADMALDNAQPKNLRALQQVGKTTATDCDDQLNDLVDMLIANKQMAVSAPQVN